MIKFFLALLIMGGASHPPQIVARYEKADECQLQTMKANSEPEMQTEDAKKTNAKFVCLQLVDDSI